MHPPAPSAASASAQSAVGATESDRPSCYSWVVFAISFALMMSDYMSRQVLLAVFPFIKAEWALSDTQLGLLVSVVALTVGVMIIPISLIADRVGRVRSITAMALIWGMATIACGLADNFFALFIARAVLGLGEAGYGSAGGAIVLQRFPLRMRSTVAGSYLSASIFGSVLGIALGGILAQQLGWRLAFILVGAGGLVLALAFPLIVREQPADGGKIAARLPLKEVARTLLTARTTVWLYLGLAATMFVQSGLIAWASTYLNRYHAMDPANAAKHAAVLALCTGVGMAGGGYVVDRLSRQDGRRRLRIPALFAFCSGLILLTAFQCSPGVLQFALMGAGLTVGACVIGSGMAVVTELAPATLHATALATMALAMNVLGSAPGPTVIGWIADRSGLHAALQLLPLPCLVSAIAFAIAANYYEADKRRLHG